jgi:hypothetical protein
MAIGRSIFVIIIMSLSSLGCLGGSVESSNNDGNSGGITYDKNLVITADHCLDM